MACKHIQPRLVAFLLGETSTRETNRIASHLCHCSTCLMDLDALRMTTNLLRNLPEERLSPAFEMKFAQGLQSLEARLRAGRTAAPTKKPFPYLPYASRWGQALAICLLAVLACVFLNPFRASHPTRHYGNIVDSLRSTHRIAISPVTKKPGNKLHNFNKDYVAITEPLGGNSVKTISREPDTKHPPALIAKATQPVSLGSIVRVVGHPKVRHEATEGWVEAKKQDNLQPATEIRCGDTDKLEVALADGSRVGFNFDTSAEIKPTIDATAKIRPAFVEIASGNAGLVVPKDEADLVVHTPTGTITAASGQFSVSVLNHHPESSKAPSAEPRTRIAVLSGQIKLSNDLGSVIAEKETQGTLFQDKPPAPPVQMQSLDVVRFHIPGMYGVYESWIPPRPRCEEALERLAGIRYRLGITIAPMPLTAAFEPLANGGPVITAITAGSPADKAGLRIGDRLLALSSRPIQNRGDLIRSEFLISGTQHIAVSILRDGVAQRLKAIPAPAVFAMPALQQRDATAQALQEANQQLARGETDAAHAAYERIIQNHPEYAAAYNNLGVCQEMAGELEPAVVSYRRALAITPKTALFNFNLGMAYYAVGNLTRARVAYQETLNLDPIFPRAGFLLGRMLNFLGDHDGAVKEALTLQKVPSTRVAGYLLAGEIKRLQAKYEEAKVDYLSALELDPYEITAYIDLGAINFYQTSQTKRKSKERLEKTTIAMQYYQKALLLDPNSSKALSGMAMIQYGQNDLAAAEALMHKAISLYPYAGGLRNNLGAIYVEKHEYQLARIAYRQALQLAPDMAACHAGYAEALAKSGRTEQDEPSYAKAAIKEYEVALALDPTYEPGYRGLIALCEKLGDKQLAQNWTAISKRFHT
jgi:tetratricopeptide (TPR) repeat protein